MSPQLHRPHFCFYWFVSTSLFVCFNQTITLLRTRDSQRNWRELWTWYFCQCRTIWSPFSYVRFTKRVANSKLFPFCSQVRNNQCALTHWGLNAMADILPTTYSNAFSFLRGICHISIKIQGCPIDNAPASFGTDNGLAQNIRHVIT